MEKLILRFSFLITSTVIALIVAVPIPLQAAGQEFGPKQAVSDQAGVNISYLNRFLKVSAPGIEARIGPDGCIATLLHAMPGESYVHIPNFLQLGLGLPYETEIGGSRGAYFYQDGFIPLPAVRQEGKSTVVAESGKASARYEFAPYAMHWTLTNKTDRPMQFLMVIDPAINAVIGEQGKILKTPVIGLWPDTTWFRDSKYKLHITGGDRVWSAASIAGTDWRQGQFQVWEATLKPKEIRAVVLTETVATKEEVDAVTAIVPLIPYRGTSPNPMIEPKPSIAGVMRVFSPCDYQVFQRQTRTQGNLFVDGDVQPDFKKVQIRITGTSIKGALPGAWMDLPVNKITRGYHATIPTPAGGWYQVDLRALDSHGKVVASASLPHVGVGEVFVTCGQSNSTNCGAERTRTQTGMVSSFGGDQWRLADDPQPGVRDSSEWGSPWPSFGDAMAAKYRVPIAIAATGQGGAPVTNWGPKAPAFAWTMDRVNQLGVGGFRGILWHQGESNTKDTNEFYFTNLSATIAASYSQAGWKFPWFVAQTSYHNPKEVWFAAPRDAQQRLWIEGIAFEGPDTDKLIGDCRDGGHFHAGGLKTHGELWAGKVSAYLDRILAD